MAWTRLEEGDLVKMTQTSLASSLGAMNQGRLNPNWEGGCQNSLCRGEGTEGQQWWQNRQEGMVVAGGIKWWTVKCWQQQ